MPTYDFECPDCGNRFEQMQSITAKPLKKCPRCGKRRVRRLIGTGGGLIFKGSGFYLTDYARKGGEKSENKPEGGETKTESKPAETKPAESKPAETKPTESKKPAKPAKGGK
jgi:putative FmdB family regulatory protein